MKYLKSSTRLWSLFCKIVCSVKTPATVTQGVSPAVQTLFHSRSCRDTYAHNSVEGPSLLAISLELHRVASLLVLHRVPRQKMKQGRSNSDWHGHIWILPAGRQVFASIAKRHMLNTWSIPLHNASFYFHSHTYLCIPSSRTSCLFTCFFLAMNHFPLSHASQWYGFSNGPMAWLPSRSPTQ